MDLKNGRKRGDIECTARKIFTARPGPDPFKSYFRSTAEAGDPRKAWDKFLGGNRFFSSHPHPTALMVKGGAQSLGRPCPTWLGGRGH